MNIVPGLILKTTSTFLKNPVRNVFISDLKIKWKRPVKPKFWEPVVSGDRGTYEQPNEDDLMKRYQVSEELKTASDDVKKLFTLGFNEKHTSNLNYQYALKDLVRRHNLDAGSVEVRIAGQTAAIRFYQDCIRTQTKRNGQHNKRVKRLIDKRNKNLRYLRRWDYKRYEWLLELLNIEFKLQPETHTLIARKVALRRLTNIHCDDIKNERLTEYRKHLQSQKEQFLSEKLKNLQFIRNEEIELDLPVTVSEKDLQEVEEKYNQLKEEREEALKKIDSSRKWTMY